MKKKLIMPLMALVLLVSILTRCFQQEQDGGQESNILADVPFGNMTISSSAFVNGSRIPAEYTADGVDISPPLNFGNIPENAKSLVLIVDDPDASGGTWIHWLVWNIPPSATGFSEGAHIVYPNGENGWGKTEYIGPSPPSGTHHYYFKLYALDTMLDLGAGAKINQLQNAMVGHTIEKAELIGLYGQI